MRVCRSGTYPSLGVLALPAASCPIAAQVDPADVVIVEGILVLHVPELRDQLNMKVYVDTGGQGCVDRPGPYVCASVVLS